MVNIKNSIWIFYMQAVFLLVPYLYLSLFFIYQYSFELNGCDKGGGVMQDPSH